MKVKKETAEMMLQAATIFGVSLGLMLWVGLIVFIISMLI